MAIGHQSFYQAQLTAGISDTDLVIPLDTVPTPSEGFLVIESTVPAKREIIYYTSKDGSSVTCPSGAGNGRGYDGTTAVSHLQNAEVIMAPVGAMFEELGDITVNSITIADTTSSAGWSPLGDVPDTVTANGNRSYDLVFNSNDLTDTVSPGMRLQLTRTVPAPDQCTSLNGSSQYWSKSSPSGMTFTDDFSVSAWVKLDSYGTANICGRYNGTNGWQFAVGSNGTVYLVGRNASSANYSQIESYQSLPLNRWVHVAAQLDMSAYSASTTESYVMFDGVDVPARVSRGGTNPTALVQAGDLEVGSNNGGSSPFDGSIAQVAIYSAKVTQATHLAAMSQGLSGSETSLISAYSFDGNANDLNANANNLTANGGAAATTDDSPFENYGASTNKEYAIVMKAAFSTNTTLTVQVPDGCAIPTSGGVDAVYYSTHEYPYGFPITDAVIDYKMRASQAFSTTSQVLIPGMTIRVRSRQGRRIKLFAQASYTGGVSGSSANMAIWQGDVSTGTQLSTMKQVASNNNYVLTLHTETVQTVPSDDVTYNVGIASSTTGGTIEGSLSNPILFWAEEL